ncbi:MAG: MFS transporter [Acidimicrobiales bacterium]
MSTRDDALSEPAAPHASPMRTAAITYGVMTMIALGFCNALQNGESNAVGNALEGIKHTFHVTDFALGASALLGSVGGSWGAIPIAALCNRYKRVRVLAVMFTVWSGLMFFAGSVPLLLVGMGGFVIFSFFRLLIGWMEATDPAAYPLISDYYPHDQRASRISVFQGLAALGTIIGLGLSGPIVDEFGWRGAFYMWIPLGLAGAWLIGRQPEPARGAQDAGAEGEVADVVAVAHGLDDLVAEQVATHLDLERIHAGAAGDFPDPATSSNWEVLRAVLSLRTWLLTAVAMGIAQMMQTGLMFWGLSFMKRSFHMSATQASLATLALGPPGLVGVLVGGFLADRLLRRGVLRARVWAAGLSYVGSGVFCVLAFGSTVELPALIFLGCGSFMIGAAQGPAFATLYDVTPAPLRAEGAALSNILMWPSALGNAIVGGLSTLTGSLRIALALTSPLFIVGGVILLILSATTPPAWAGKGYVRAVEDVVLDARRRARE